MVCLKLRFELLHDVQLSARSTPCLRVGGKRADKVLRDEAPISATGCCTMQVTHAGRA